MQSNEKLLRLNEQLNTMNNQLNEQNNQLSENNNIKAVSYKHIRAIKPVNEADVETMMTILNRMREEDPTWVIDQ